jgi:hypothetical protein
MSNDEEIVLTKFGGLYTSQRQTLWQRRQSEKIFM